VQKPTMKPQAPEAKPMSPQSAYKHRLMKFRDEALFLRERVVKLEAQVAVIADILGARVNGKENVHAKGR
jgi:hypothetical protein